MFDIDKALNELKLKPQHPDDRLRENTRLVVQQEIRRKQSAKRPRRLTWAFPAVAAVLVAFVFLFVLTPAADEVSYVTIDINPSVSMQLNASNTVLSVSAENDDAKMLLENMKLAGLQFEEALGAVVQAADAQGYLKDDGHVLVACFGNEPGINQRQIEKTVSESTRREVRVMLLQSSKKVFEEAKAHKLKPGVALLKKQAIEQGIKEQDVDEIIDQMVEQTSEKKNAQENQSEKNENRPTASANSQSEKVNGGADNEMEKGNQEGRDDSKVNKDAAKTPAPKSSNGDSSQKNKDKANGNAADNKTDNSSQNTDTGKTDNDKNNKKVIKGDRQ